jgi:multidrug resistance efflux pump
MTRLTSHFGVRSVRIFLALVLIGMSLWAFVPYVAYHVSSSAFVNAELMRVTAPISGYLSNDVPRKGTFIDHPKKLTLVQSYSVDRRRLLDLERQRSIALARGERARKQLADLEAQDKLLKTRIDAYREGMLKRLGDEIAEAQAETTGCRQESQQRSDTAARMQKLSESGRTSQIRTNEALAKHEAVETQCDMAAARLKRLQTELDALRDGVFLRDATNDVPYSQQQRERLFLRRQELEGIASEERVRAHELAADIAEEARHVEDQQKYQLTLPSNHVVWSVPASPGSVLMQGQKALDLADCRHRFVTVELPEAAFESIKVGEPASVRLIGSDEWRTGEVRQILGSAAHVDDRLLAAQVPKPTSGHITVEVSLPEPATNAENNYCNIGRLADVRFPRAAPAFAERLSSLFDSLLSRLRTSDKVASQ